MYCSENGSRGIAIGICSFAYVFLFHHVAVYLINTWFIEKYKPPFWWSFPCFLLFLFSIPPVCIYFYLGYAPFGSILIYIILKCISINIDIVYTFLHPPHVYLYSPLCVCYINIVYIYLLPSSLLVQLRLGRQSEFEETVKEVSAKLSLVPLPPPGQLHVVRPH